jgi:RHS repeat-associated protein
MGNLLDLVGGRVTVRFDALVTTSPNAVVRRTSILLLATIVLAGPVIGTTAAGATVSNASAFNQTSRLYNRVQPSHAPGAETLHTNTPTTPLYTAGEFYGGSNPTAACYTCNANAVTGTAPPSGSLDSGSGIDNLTGDYTYSQNVFDAPNIGSDLSFSLTYDAQLAQTEIANDPLPPTSFGWGWTSNLVSSITQQTVGGSQVVTVNQGDSAQAVFNESASSGTSTSCPVGDLASTMNYTMWDMSFSSADNYCALANVQSQLGNDSNALYFYQAQNDSTLSEYSWTGSLMQEGSLDSLDGGGNTPAGIDYYYNVAPGTIPTNPSYSSLQECPTTAYQCTIEVGFDIPPVGTYSVRDVVEVYNSSDQITQVIDPSGVTYDLTYDTHKNLTSVESFANQSSASSTSFVYTESAPSPYLSDLTEIYDPDAGVSTPASLSPGIAHSTTINYQSTGASAGMATSIEDGTATSTSYAYSQNCATTPANCFGTTATQTTTVTYPTQVPCPGCTAVSPVEVDSYSAGVLSSSSLGSTSNSYNNETWNYSWSWGNGTTNSVETITYPDSISGNPVTSSATLDPAGDVTSTTDALGNVATSGWVYTEGCHELIWSYPGASSNGPTTPPSGAWVYSYDFCDQIATSTSPMLEKTQYAYTAQGLLCGVLSPQFSASTLADESCDPNASNLASLPAGITLDLYDQQGDLVSQTIDDNDTSASADVQTTTSSYNVMGDRLWSIPPSGQAGVQSAANPYATVATYTPANLVHTVTPPGQSATTDSYDAALNLVTSVTPAATTTNVYDGDDRPCYQVTAGTQAGLTCISASQAGSSKTTYVPGSTNPLQVTDANGHATSYYYGDLAYPNATTEVVDAAGTEVQYNAYNDYGDVCDAGSVTIPTGASTQCNTIPGDTTTVVNAIGNETSITDPSGNTTTRSFTNPFYPTLVTSSKDALNDTTTYSYDALGRPVLTWNPDGTLLETSYDANGQVCNETNNESNAGCGGGTGEPGTTNYVYDNGSEETSSSTTSSYNPSVIQVSAGQGDFCVLLAGGTAQCWGGNPDGENGNGTTTASTTPVNVSGLTAATQIDVGEWNQVCALLSSGSVKCWGNGTNGDLGDGATANSSTPVSVTGLTGATQIAVGYDHACALLSGGSVKCWGDNSQGELGTGTTTNASTPVSVSGLSGVTQIAAGSDDTCALLTGGTVECWGANSDGQVGDGTTTGELTGVSTPAAVSGLSGVTQISVGGEEACAILSTGTVSCWGSNYYGELGNHSTTNSSTPVPVSYLSGVTQIAVGDDHVCALASGWQDVCWGNNMYGQIGNGSTTMSSVPTSPSIGSINPTSIATGEGDSCAMVAGVLECWGAVSNSDFAYGSPVNLHSPTPWDPILQTQTTTNTYVHGQLIGATDPNGKTMSYLYNYDGQVACETYPVSSSTSCGTLGSPATGSATNSIINRSYDPSGRVSGVSDWLGNTTQYTYGDDWTPNTPTKITYPSSSGLVANYTYDDEANLTALTVGSSINDAWTYSTDEQEATAKVGSTTSATTGYNANSQITAATNLATQTTNDSYTLLPNGEITKDVPPSGATTSFGYLANGELCWAANLSASSSVCSSAPTTASILTNYTYTQNGQRSSATTTTSSGTTTTNYDWNSQGQLCNLSTTGVTACGTIPTSGASYLYNGNGLRTTEVTSSTVGASNTTITTDSTWDGAAAGSIPLNINDASTSSASPGTTTNTSYVYSNLLFGGAAPTEQITSTSSGATAAFLVASPQGIQGVYGPTGTSLQQSLYSTYGVETIKSGTKVTPFGFQGAYSDLTGLIYLINRYYDPATDQFLSIDPAVESTGQPYVFTNDNSLNSTDPFGLLAAALMGSGFQTPEQQAATINLLLNHQYSSGESIAGSRSNVQVAKGHGKTVLVDVIIPHGFNVFNPNSHHVEVASLELDKTVVGRQNSSQVCNQSKANASAENVLVAGTFTGSASVSTGTILEMIGTATGAETGGIGFVLAGFGAIIAGGVGAVVVDNNC